MTTLTEVLRAGHFLISEANGYRSREQVTVLSGQNLKVAHVVGKVTHSTSGSSAPFAGNTGNGAMGAITVGAGAKVGDYKLVIIEPGANAGKFSLEDPDGVIVGTGTVAAAFSAGGIGFTLADGSTDFIAGDGFTITVAAVAEKYKLYDPANTDGSERVAGIMYDACDASAADKAGVIVARDAEIVAADLLWFSGATTDQKTAGRAELARLGIISR
jgi:hypothetical protein